MEISTSPKIRMFPTVLGLDISKETPAICSRVAPRSESHCTWQKMQKNTSAIHNRSKKLQRRLFLTYEKTTAHLLTSKMWPMATVVSSKRNMSIPSPWLGVFCFFRMVGMWRTKVELEGWGSWIPSYPEPAKIPIRKIPHDSGFFLPFGEHESKSLQLDFSY